MKSTPALDDLPDYDVVIATRNRPEALELSIPLLLQQTPPPHKVIVVDSSDDHPAVKAVVEKCFAGAGIPLTIIHARPGLTAQRNIGLESVESEIVFYPDDDSLFFPDTAQKILEIYGMDSEKKLGGVCAAEAVASPLADATQAVAYRMSDGDQAKNRRSHLRTRLEQTFYKDPFILHGRSFYPQSCPDWYARHDVVPVEYMTGFRMTFRTESIRRRGFEEAFEGYCLFEDVDACFSVLEDQGLVGARQARIHHHKFPSARSNPYLLGFTQILNRNYVTAKHSPPGSAARGRATGYGLYKLLQYAVSCHRAMGRERFRGAWDALRASKSLFAAEREMLAEVYVGLRNRYLN